jgi:20S proteasome alpha/beta subunit
MWDSEKHPYLSCVTLPYDRIECKYRNREESTMSIAIALTGTDGIVIATDERAIGYGRHRDDEKKLWKLDNNWYLTTVSDCIILSKALIPVVKEQMHDDLTSEICEDVMDGIQKKLSQKFKCFVDSFPLASITPNPLSQLDTRFILAGYDNRNFRIVELGTELHSPFFIPAYPVSCIHSCSEVAHYLLTQFYPHLYKKNKDDEYEPLQKTVVLKNIAIMIMIEANRHRNNDIGDNIQMVVIKEKNAIPVKDSESLRDKIALEIVKSRGDLFQRLKEIA